MYFNINVNFALKYKTVQFLNTFLKSMNETSTDEKSKLCFSEMFIVFMLQHAKQILPYLLSVLRGLPTAEWKLGPQRTYGYSWCY